MAFSNNENIEKQYAAQYQAHATPAAGYAAPVSLNPPKGAPLAEKVTQELAIRLEGIHQLSMRVARVADRILGSEPQAGQPATDRPAPSALTDKFSMLYSTAVEIETALRNQVERLEHFV